MPRPPRPDHAGAFHHITVRGVRKSEIFVDRRDREHLLMRLENAVSRYGWICHAYCLMGNHFHLLLETPQPTLSAGMQFLNSRYAEWFNLRHGFEGHVLERPFGSLLVESEWHMLEAARYVVLNPVRAGIRTHPAAWPGSSYRATAGLDPVPPFLTTSWLLAHFGSEPPRACAAYVAFVEAGLGARAAKPDLPRGLTPAMA